MKFISILMLFALVFGGFTAAGHAMGPDNCVSSEVQIDDCSPEMQKSSDHAQKHKASGNGACVDCAHCCVSSIIPSSEVLWEMIPAKSAVVSALVDLQPQGRLFSLLRPPRTLA